jgi:hypothetical protein
MPLSAPDRKRAALNIIAMHPDWSDRSVAAATGLSDKTVSGVRAGATADGSQSNARVGRDGRVRPLNSADRRRQAATILTQRPDAGLREIARVTGLSPATVRDVRSRTVRGEDPVPARYRQDGAAGEPTPIAAPRVCRSPESGRPATGVDRLAVLSKIGTDPSIRLNESGRFMLQWLLRRSIDPGDSASVVAKVPDHWVPTVAQLARSCAAAWSELADQLEDRVNAKPDTLVRLR